MVIFSEMAGANNKSFFGGGNHIVASVIDSSGIIFSDDEIMSLWSLRIHVELTVPHR